MPLPPGRSPALVPFWTSRDGKFARLYLGNVTDVLARLPEKSVHCVVTSPPYWGLRDYGTGTWQGGDMDCDHLKPPVTYIGKKSTLMTDGRANPGHNDQHKYTAGREQFKRLCDKCGAKRADQQLGSEPSPDCGTHGQAQCGRCFVCAMVAVFREVRRVLRDDGTLWMNLGDTYSGGGIGGGPKGVGLNGPSNRHRDGGGRATAKPDVIPSGNLIGVPWRVALALQADGWVLRQDVIWHKPAPMPESVRNRCTKSHEYLFLMTKGMGYYCDMESIKEAATQKPQRRSKPKGKGRKGVPGQPDHNGSTPARDTPQQDGDGRSNRRSVWRIASEGYDGAHFATFPPSLVEPCVNAGTSERGCCPECGAPFRRVTEETPVYRDRPNAHVKYEGQGPNGQPDQTKAGVNVRTVGWEPGCGCDAGDPVPCTVLDPFVGSGTTVMVANRLERRGIGIDLSEDYLRNHAAKRISGRPFTETK